MQQKEQQKDLTLLRIGQGFDAHRFGPLQSNLGKHSIPIGGVAVPFQRSIVAHSDGDVLLHAIGDALLGALALGDLGAHFSDQDPQWQNIDSRKLLHKIHQMITTNGYEVINVDSTVVAQAPKLAPHITAIRQNIATELAITPSQVSVKATTTERMGFTGREEGIAAQAIVLLAALVE